MREKQKKTIIRIINDTFEHVLNNESNFISDKYRDINMQLLRINKQIKNFKNK